VLWPAIRALKEGQSRIIGGSFLQPKGPTLFNVLVKYGAWADGRDKIPYGRLFEHTDEELAKRFEPGGSPDFNSLAAFPSLFIQESSSKDNELARVGTITHARTNGREIALEYAFDLGILPIPNNILQGLAAELEINRAEFSRTHWAVKDVDLYRVLLRNSQPRRHRPQVFSLSEHENIEPTLVSAMMPFHPDFDSVYAALQKTATASGLRCRRADDIWENPIVIQDVVSLIDRSNMVICDCTGRNANVFYEIGIAHTLGRRVILITQNEQDIPFDLRHLRYLPYLNNKEGLEALSTRLRAVVSDIAQ
jgi:hypothetical protein